MNLVTHYHITKIPISINNYIQDFLEANKGIHNERPTPSLMQWQWCVYSHMRPRVNEGRENSPSLSPGSDEYLHVEVPGMGA